MFKEKYKKMNDSIFPSQELIEKVTHLPYREKAGRAGREKRFRRPAFILCAIIIFALTAMPALAATFPSIYDLMYLVSPSTAQFFIPVQKSCLSNGIKMEVVSAYIHGDTAEIYITMEDLEGSRIDESIDLNDSYSLYVPFDSSANCQRLGYDDAAKKATFLITIKKWGDKKISGGKLTFSVNEFLSHRKEYKDVLISKELSGLNTSSEKQRVNINGGGGPYYENYISDMDKKINVLKPSEPREFPIEGLDFTGIGYIDGMLHIQTAAENNLKKGNHGYFILKDKQGSEVTCDYSVGFIENPDVPERIDYNEEVFNVPESQIENYSLYGYFVTSGMYTEGEWKVTFVLENEE